MLFSRFTIVRSSTGLTCQGHTQAAPEDVQADLGVVACCCPIDSRLQKRASELQQVTDRCESLTPAFVCVRRHHLPHGYTRQQHIVVLIKPSHPMAPQPLPSPLELAIRRERYRRKKFLPKERQRGVHPQLQASIDLSSAVTQECC